MKKWTIWFGFFVFLFISFSVYAQEEGDEKPPTLNFSFLVKFDPITAGPTPQLCDQNTGCGNMISDGRSGVLLTGQVPIMVQAGIDIKRQIGIYLGIGYYMDSRSLTSSSMIPDAQDYSVHLLKFSLSTRIFFTRLKPKRISPFLGVEIYYMKSFIDTNNYYENKYLTGFFDHFGLAPSFGVEYMFARFFGLSGEAGFRFITNKYDDERNQANIMSYTNYYFHFFMSISLNFHF